MPTLFFSLKFVQIAVVAITLGLLSVGIYGVSQIKVTFDPFKLLDQSGYLSKFFEVYHEGKCKYNLSLKDSLFLELVCPCLKKRRSSIVFLSPDFPGNGWPANIFTGEIRYTLEDFTAVDHIVTKMEVARWNKTYISGI